MITAEDLKELARRIEGEYYSKTVSEGYCKGDDHIGVPCHKQCLECFTRDWHKKSEGKES